MCGRFALFSDIKSIMKYADILADDFEWQPHYNISPGMNIPLVIKSNHRRVLSSAKWGFIPHFATNCANFNIINAKAETIDEKYMFKHSFQYNRCLIPANGFYEWRTKDKQPFLISVKKQNICFFAGIYNHEHSQNEDTCAIITTKANKVIESIHHRMPVIIREENLHRYLFEEDGEMAKEMLLSYPEEAIVMKPVSKKVNYTRNNYPALIEEIKEQNNIPFSF